MYKYIILCLSVSLCGVLSDLYKEEGADCEWEGVKGKCVEETRCMTALDTENPKQPVCSKKGEVTIICCTDCKLVNDTRNVVITPTADIYWKDSRGKARDHCLQYIKDLPYQCHRTYYARMKRTLVEDQNCHGYMLFGIAGPPAIGDKELSRYPHQVLLGFKDSESEPSLETALWFVGGSIISDRFILTAAHVARGDNSPLYVAAHVQNRSVSPSQWQTHKVKRFIPHPEYKPRRKYNDIALIETETPITFDENVLPACLHVDAEARDIEAVATTWRDVANKNYKKMADTIQTIKLEKFTDAECDSHYQPSRLLVNGLDHTTQTCYGNRVESDKSCMGLSGEPLLIDTQFSHCVHTVIGVTSFGSSCGAGKPDVYTRVAPYISWIESVVWP